MDEVICNDCGWTGDATQLVCASSPALAELIEHIGHLHQLFACCPKCGSSDIENIDPDKEGRQK